MLVLDAQVVYSLPTTAGHWLPNALCLAYRQLCPQTGADGGADPACVATREACSLLPDETAANGEAVPPSVDGVACQPRGFVQPPYACIILYQY